MGDSMTGYVVLARRYRPARFDGLIGQEGLVQTLSNGLKTGRMHHAFMLTGVRGVGKTTTARIIALALNCSRRKEDEAEPCGECEECTAILAGRHMDVVEMDAASHTGVDDIRNLIAQMAYAPLQGKKKVYIIDEVHMLSKNAFNALLKTLEEPPPHIVFVFATTEIRRIPATIISRCQRFDLRRVDLEQLSAHFSDILEQESISADQEALHAIARAADGSVRDGLSLLDQAIAQEGRHISLESIEKMLHLHDRQGIFDLFDAVISGEGAERPLLLLHQFYTAGTEPLQLVRDLMEWVHMVTKFKVTSALASKPWFSQLDRREGMKVAEKLSLPVLMRLWQILLKGEAEIRTAPEPIQAFEMVLLRLVYGAALPTPPEPASLEPDSPEPASLESASPESASPESASPESDSPESDSPESASPESASPESASPESASPESASLPPQTPQDFMACITLFEEKGEIRLGHILSSCVGLTDYTLGSMTLCPKKEFLSELKDPQKTARDIARCLTAWTSIAWQVNFSEESSETPSITENQEQKKQQELEQARQENGVLKALDLFPGATLRDVKTLEKPPSEKNSSP